MRRRLLLLPITLGGRFVSERSYSVKSVGFYRWTSKLCYRSYCESISNPNVSLSLRRRYNHQTCRYSIRSQYAFSEETTAADTLAIKLFEYIHQKPLTFPLVLSSQERGWTLETHLAKAGVLPTSVHSSVVSRQPQSRLQRHAGTHPFFWHLLPISFILFMHSS